MMMKYIKYILLFAAFAAAEKQIKLEDIERDNLLSERRVNRDEDTVKNGESQHLLAPIYVGSSNEASSENEGNDLGEDIIYAQPAPSDNNQYEGKSGLQTSIQYVTPQQYEKDYGGAKPTTASFVHPVHEAPQTYSAPARESLINPILFKPAASPSPYLSQQPKFVYVQAGPQQISPNGVLTYGRPQHSIENSIQTQQKNAQDDITYAAVEQNHIAETSQQAANAPTRPTTAFLPRALQYYPLLAQTSSFPNYVMIFRNPQSHAQAFSYPSIQYAQPGLVGPTQVPTAVAPQPHLAAPQSTLAATFINPTIGATAVLPSPEPTAIPAGTLLLQPAVDYSHQLHHHHAQQYPQYAHQLTYDILQSLQKPHPTSLLDSYVPSSVIWATAQRQRNSPFLNRQILHPIHGNFITPTIAHPAQQFYQQPHGSHQPGYNTIAYSTAQAYSKRSPKLVTERPLKLKKRN